MFRNYLKIALRNLWKQRTYAFINVFGLAVGLAFCTLIFLYVREELTYDRFHEKHDRIYRAYRASYDADGSMDRTDPYLPMPFAPAMAADMPEVEAYVRFWRQSYFLRRGDDILEERIVHTDPAFFDVFSFPLRRGDPATALVDLNSIVLTEASARKYFGDQDPMGQVLSVRMGEQYQDLVVTGVAADPPGNSSVRFDFLVPFARFVETFDWARERQESWNASAFLSYVLLKPGATLAGDAERLLQFRWKYYPEEVRERQAAGRWSGEGFPTRYRLQPLGDIHLNTAVSGGLTAPSDPRYAYILAGIALAVLFIACVNFMTLAMGRSARRAREIGVRKVVGAARGQIIMQFWGEALMLCSLALVVGMALADLSLPVFNTLTGKALQLNALYHWSSVLALGGVVLVTGLLAGSYPALVLSGFQPVEALKNRLQLSGSNALTRSLVVGQFALSVFLIISTFVMLDQLDYLQTKNLGFDKEHVVVVELEGADRGLALSRLREAVAQRPDIAGITGSSISFNRGYARTGFEYEGELKQVFVYRVEQDYVDVMGMKLAAGRNFDPQLATDSTQAILVNEALVRDFGWTDPVGQRLTGLTESTETDPVVIGVLEDYNFQSLESEVQPMMLNLAPNARADYALIRINPVDVPATLAYLEATWQSIAPDVPFQHAFLDEDLNAQYRDSERWSRIVGYASFFAILIACMGLFGLTALIVAGRTKEIGIRKVLGASVANVMTLLSRDFVVLVLLGILIAVPAAYFVMQEWLTSFAFRITISPFLYVAAGVLALLVALGTVSVQAVRAALTDPVDTLRYE
jgi:putative ABC transport system permease protein